MDVIRNLLGYSVPLWQVLAIVLPTFIYAFGNKSTYKNVTPSKHTVNINSGKNQEETNTMSKVTESTHNDKLDELKDDDDDDNDDDDEDMVLNHPVRDDYSVLKFNTDIQCKMLLCVNMELSMDKGKIAAQCGHGTLGAYLLAKKYCNSAVQIWYNFGQTKIAVKVPKEQEFEELISKAKSYGIVYYLVRDAGRTQIPAGSKTVLALGPAPKDLLDKITGHLKLL